MSMRALPRPGHAGSGSEFALLLTRLWLLTYTTGLPSGTRDRRRAEMASDLFEHRRSADAEGRRFTAELCWRWLTGVPADLAWRLENARLFAQIGGFLLSVLLRGFSGGRWTVNRGLPGVTICLVGFYAIVGVGLFATLGFGKSSASERIVIALILLGSGALIVGGLRLVIRRRIWGMLLVLIGALPLAFAMSASIVVPLASAAAILTGLVRMVKAPERPGRIL